MKSPYFNNRNDIDITLFKPRAQSKEANDPTTELTTTFYPITVEERNNFRTSTGSYNKRVSVTYLELFFLSFFLFLVFNCTPMGCLQFRVNNSKMTYKDVSLSVGSSPRSGTFKTFPFSYFKHQ